MMSFTMPSNSFFAQAKSTKSWKINDLKTAENADYLSAIEKGVITEVNMVRSNPKKYSDTYIKPLLQFYEGLYFRYPGKVPVVTAEGKSALLDCIDALEEAAPAGLLYPSHGLSLAARDLQKDQQTTGQLGHTGRDGSNPFDRMKRYGTWDKKAAENIDYGNDSARWIVISLLIDDGVPGRGHRKSLLSPDYELIGIAFGIHPTYGTMCVMDLAGSFKEN